MIRLHILFLTGTGELELYEVIYIIGTIFQNMKKHIY